MDVLVKRISTEPLQLASIWEWSVNGRSRKEVHLCLHMVKVVSYWPWACLDFGWSSCARWQQRDRIFYQCPLERHITIVIGNADLCSHLNELSDQIQSRFTFTASSVKLRHYQGVQWSHLVRWQSLPAVKFGFHACTLGREVRQIARCAWLFCGQSVWFLRQSYYVTQAGLPALPVELWSAQMTGTHGTSHYPKQFSDGKAQTALARPPCVSLWTRFDTGKFDWWPRSRRTFAQLVK